MLLMKAWVGRKNDRQRGATARGSAVKCRFVRSLRLCGETFHVQSGRATPGPRWSSYTSVMVWPAGRSVFGQCKEFWMMGMDE